MINCPALRDQIQKYFSQKLAETQKKFVKLTETIEKKLAEEEVDTVISSEAEIQLDKIMTDLQKLKKALSNPNFGTCMCGNGIEIARLNTDPSVTQCGKCAPPKKAATVLQFKRKEKEKDANTSNV